MQVPTSGLPQRACPGWAQRKTGMAPPNRTPVISRASGARKAGSGGVDPQGGVTSAVELERDAHIRAVVRHGERTELARECRRALQSIAARPCKPDGDVCGVVQVETGIGAAAQRDRATPHPPGLAARTRPAAVEKDLRPCAGGAEPPGAFVQNALRVGLEPAGRFGQSRPADAAGENHDRADQQDPHGRTLASTGTELRRLTNGN
jgi:hypothetical protein